MNVTFLFGKTVAQAGSETADSRLQMKETDPLDALVTEYQHPHDPTRAVLRIPGGTEQGGFDDG